MEPTTADGAIARVRRFWRRALLGPSPGARIEIYEELAPTLAAGIGVVEALDSSASRNGGRKLRAIRILADGVARDVPLSETMRANPDSFSALEAALVATGERTGRLDIAFRAASAELDRARALRNRIIQAVAYPLFLVHALVMTVSLVHMFGGGSFLAFAVPAVAGIWGGFLAAASLHAALADSTAYATFLGRLPVIGSAVRTAALTRFSRALAALHGAGMTYDESLRIAAEASGSPLLRADAAVAGYAMSRGAPLPAALAQMPSLPGEVLGILVAGEASGELEAAALRVAQLQEERGEVVTKRAIALLPGCLVAIVGLVVALLAFNVIGGYYKSMLDVMK